MLEYSERNTDESRLAASTMFGKEFDEEFSKIPIDLLWLFWDGPYDQDNNLRGPMPELPFAVMEEKDD